ALGAQAPAEPLTLQQAIAIAQRQGFEARSAAEIRSAARSRDRAFIAAWLPSLSIRGTAPTYTRSIIPVTQPDGSTLYRELQQTDAALTATITQRVPWTNTTLSFTSGLSEVQKSGDPGFRTWSSTPFSVGLAQPILRANTQRWDLREQDLRVTSAERKYLEAREDVAIATTDAFFALYSARLTLRNAEKNVATNDTLYKLNQSRLELGRIGENDLLQSELALLRARSALDDARLTHDRALSQFRLALNMPPGTPVDIVATAAVPALDADTTLAMRQARANASAMSDADASEVRADRTVSEERWNRGAGGTLTASYGYNATAPTAGDAYKNLLDAQRLTFSVDLPVWQWGQHSASVAAAKAERESAKATAALSRAQVEQNARFAALQLTQARQGLLISAKADTVAAKWFEAAYYRFVIGRITLDNLYNAQDEKDRALAAYVQALRAYWIAYHQLRKTTLYDFEEGRSIR
ncbi:MAG TPA: TolC family protein, partial [Gemmatimonadaceae bacterium]